MWCCKHRHRGSVLPPAATAAEKAPLHKEGKRLDLSHHRLGRHLPYGKEAKAERRRKGARAQSLAVPYEGESKVSVGVYPHQSKHWEALELSDCSTKEEIKAKYRKLSVKYHPDKNQEDGAKERFQRITEAYEALKETDGQLAFPWERFPERQQMMKGSDLIRTLGFLGAEAAQQDPIKAQFMQQVVKEATDCKVLLHDTWQQVNQEIWADALCVDERSGANHLVKVYRRIVSGAAQAIAAKAVPLALRAMSTHQKSPSVQVKGCEVLRLLVELSPEVPLDEIAEASMRAKRLFPSDRLVHRAVDLVLSFAVPRSAACIGALMDAATKDEMVQRSGICSLGHLAKHGGVAWRGATNTAVNRILRALQHHKGSAALQASGLWALGRLAERLEAPGGGMQDAAQRAKQLHPDSALVQRHADELIAFLLRP
eukprot:s739_g15.t6